MRPWPPVPISPRTPWRMPRMRLTWPLAPSPAFRPSMTPTSDWLMTAVGPPDWPIAALPVDEIRHGGTPSWLAYGRLAGQCPTR